LGIGKRIGRPVKVAALLAAGAAGGAAAIAVATVPGSDGVIHACVQLSGTLPANNVGNLRVIDPGAGPGQTCSTTAPSGGLAPEATLDWNVAGPRGASGPIGLQGRQGAEGQTLTISGQTFSISGLKATGTVQQPGLVAPLAPNLRGRPMGILSFGSGRSSPSSSIEIYSWSFGASQAGASHATGGGAGKSSVHEIQITKSVDKASPKLFQACATGQHFKKVTLSLRKAGGTPYLTLTLTDVLISSYQQSNGGDRPAESISLNFTKIEYKYSQHA
jgi:type VI secretion system secreted protein Hcp